MVRNHPAAVRASLSSLVDHRIKIAVVTVFQRFSQLPRRPEFTTLFVETLDPFERVLRCRDHFVAHKYSRHSNGLYRQMGSTDRARAFNRVSLATVFVCTSPLCSASKWAGSKDGNA